MKKLFTLGILFLSVAGMAQEKTEKKPIQIFSAEKVINANTTETVGAGKMVFKVSHNFGDIAGDNGGIKRFFGMDNSTDIRIGFQIGLGKNFDVIAARAKGTGLQQQLLELGAKYKLMEQREDDPTHPLSIALFANAVVSSSKASAFPNQDNSFKSFSDRMSNVLQLILAKKIGNISVQLNPTFVTRGYAMSYDQKSMFSLGAALKLPLVANRLNLVVDYFHTFRNESTKNAFLTNDNIKFHDPLGVGFEILTSGHIFRLNFTNATELLENRFIPRTITSWGKGQFRWGFTISRKFRLWTAK